MTLHLRIITGCAVILYFLIIVYFVKRKTLELKYTLLWLAAGFCMGFMILFPETLTYFAKLIGIQTPMYSLFIAILFFVIIILMSLTSIVSKQTARIRKLTQQIAMYEKRIRELEEKKTVLSDRKE